MSKKSRPKDPGFDFPEEGILSDNRCCNIEFSSQKSVVSNQNIMIFLHT